MATFQHMFSMQSSQATRFLRFCTFMWLVATCGCKTNGVPFVRTPFIIGSETACCHKPCKKSKNLLKE